MREVLRKRDGSGREVALFIMPRTHFPALGFERGLRLETFLDGESIYEQTIGLSDAEVGSLIVALREAEL
jgi:hypothetical protein